jgi:hypothetical protein
MRYIFTVTVLTLFIGCTSRKVLSLSAPYNPTSYLFPISADSARFVFGKSYWRYHSGLGFDLLGFEFSGYGGIDRTRTDKIGDANKDDVWMILAVDSSYVYRNKSGRALPYRMDCLMHFEPAGDHWTKATVQVLDAKVILGASASQHRRIL